MESFLVQQQVGELLGTIAVAPQQSPVNCCQLLPCNSSSRVHCERPSEVPSALRSPAATAGIDSLPARKARLAADHLRITQ